MVLSAQGDRKERRGEVYLTGCGIFPVPAYAGIGRTGAPMARSGAYRGQRALRRVATQKPSGVGSPEGFCMSGGSGWPSNVGPGC